MRHLKVLTHQQPAPAQFEFVLQFVAAIQGLLTLVTSLQEFFGLPGKSDTA